MRQIFLLLLCLIFAATAESQVRVKGYTKKDGTYVAPHYRSSPNRTKLDNYSTRGNVNPYTGKVGTVDPYATSNYESPPAPVYVAPAPISYDDDLSSGIRNPKSLSSWETYDGDTGEEGADSPDQDYYGDDE